MIQLKCKQCGKDVYKKPYALKHYKNIFCSNQCHFKFRSRKIKVNCGFCNKELSKASRQLRQSKSGFVFCDRSCATKYNNKFKKRETYKNWKGGLSTYRLLAITHYGLKCNSKNECPLKDLILPNFMYEVDHINGDHSDNRMENLQILCVWCHRIKTYSRVS